VVDLGSGKGYLSEHLALDHALHVLGIDSTDSNSQSVSCERLFCHLSAHHHSLASHRTATTVSDVAAGASKRNVVVQKTWEMRQSKRTGTPADGRSFVPVTATINCETFASFESLVMQHADGGVYVCRVWACDPDHAT
jgi:hypothetical protein